jgi:hypothetical protein
MVYTHNHLADPTMPTTPEKEKRHKKHAYRNTRKNNG